MLIHRLMLVEYEILDIYNIGMEIVKNQWVKMNTEGKKFVLGVICRHPNYLGSVIKQFGNQLKSHS